MGFIHSKNLRATARLIVLSVMEVNFRMSRCKIFFIFLTCHVYSLYLSIFVYTIIFSVLLFEIKKDHCYQFGFLEAPCIKWDADTEHMLYVAIELKTTLLA